MSEFERTGERRPSLPRLIDDLLAGRGFVSPDSRAQLLQTSLKNLSDPFSLLDMEKAVARLVEARRAQSKIVIYADYDLDGSSGLALMLDGLRQLGFLHVEGYQPRRLTEGYGLKVEALSRLIEAGAELFLTVDLGITGVQEVDFVNQRGREIIVTDHHLPSDRLPAALAVVNPNRSDDRSGLGHLCGAGVAFFLLLGLRRRMSETEDLKGDALKLDIKGLLDLFAIGTVTDMVPLIAENRALVRHGLKQLELTRRPGLRLLLERLNLLGQPLGAQDLAIRFAPKLNALSRMEQGLLPIDVLAAGSRERAEEIVGQVLDNNQMRQDLQRSAETLAEESFRVSPDRDFAWVWSDQFHRGVVGLVATRLCQAHGVPAFVGAVSASGQVTGSARWPAGVAGNLVDVLGHSASELHQFGGHAQAAGFELSLEKVEGFRLSLRAYFAANPLKSQTQAWKPDVEAELTELNPELMNWLEALEPFGQGFPVPQILVRKLRVREVRPLKGSHWRLVLVPGTGSGEPRTAVWFGVPEGHLAHPSRWSLSSGALDPDLRVDVLTEVQWNYFRGERTLQLLVKDLRLSEA